ncbi:cellulase (glycosyl hydrolase family 5) domain-containing protein [Sarocladium implicatum]|nr:cellulase (glycosyl hydrolase family 5) domain-containing protein [Sarocladium implicatum]
MRSALLLLSAALKASATIYYAGVAESGGEFGLYVNQNGESVGLPGRFGSDYAFANPDTVDIFVDEQGFNLFRVAFVLERLCPLDTGLGATFNETYFDLYKEAIDYITVTKDAYAILDPHNYMRYNNPYGQPMSGSIIGDTTDEEAATTEQFAEFWTELADRFKDNDRVAFGIMNEPHDMATQLVFDNNQAAVDAIRSTGAKNLILVPGNNWSGGHSWTQNWGGDLLPNSEFMGKIVDPANNWVLDIHEYLDSDFSGTLYECVNPFEEAMGELTSWLRTNGLKAMVTEFGGSDSEACKSMLADALAYMEENEEYIGWTAWAAGPLWGANSACCTNQTQLGSLEPGSTAADGSEGIYDTVWLPVFVENKPETLEWEGGIESHLSGGANGTRRRF